MCRKNPKDRNIKDIQIIACMLSNTELKETSKQNDNQKLIYFCAIYVEYVYALSGTVLFTQGDIGNCFYILLKGRLDVYKDSLNSNFLRAEDYLLTLQTMYQKGKTDYINRTITVNFTIFPANYEDLKNIKNIIAYLRCKKLHALSAPIEHYRELINKYEINISEINLGLYSQRAYTNEDTILILSYLLALCKIEDSTNRPEFYNYIFEKEEKLVHIYDNEKLVSFSNGKVFGEMAFDNKDKIRLNFG